MREQSLIELGVIKEYIEAEHTGSGTKEWYYRLEFLDLESKVESIMLISNTNIECGKNWYLEFFDTNKYRFTKKSQVQRFINLMKEVDIGKKVK